MPIVTARTVRKNSAPRRLRGTQAGVGHRRHTAAEVVAVSVALGVGVGVGVGLIATWSRLSTICSASARLDASMPARTCLRAEVGQGRDLDLGDLVDVLQRDAGDVGLDALVDRHLAVVRGDEVLVLRPVVGDATGDARGSQRSRLRARSSGASAGGSAGAARSGSLRGRSPWTRWSWGWRRRPYAVGPGRRLRRRAAADRRRTRGARRRRRPSRRTRR